MRAMLVGIALIFASTVRAESHVESGSRAGARAWVSKRFLDFVAHDVVPLAVARIEQEKIPDFSGEKDSIEYSFTNFKIDFVNLISSFTLVPGEGLQISLGNIGAKIECDWSYKEKIWPHVPYGGGTAKITVDPGTNVGGTLLMGVAAGKPTVSLVGTHVNLDLGSIAIHGSMLSWLYDLLIDLTKGAIADAVSSSLTSALATFVNTDLSSILASLDLIYPLPMHPPYDIANLDNSFISILTNASHATFDMRAEVVSKNASDPPFPDIPAQLPDVPPSAFAQYMVSFSVKQMVFNSALWVYWKHDLLIDTVHRDDISKSFPLQLDTDSFAVIAPGLAKLYPHANMTMTVSASAQPKVTLDAAASHAAKVSFPSHLAFDVIFPNGSTTPAFTLFAPVNVSVNMWVPKAIPQVLEMNISLLSVTPIGLVSSNVGVVRTNQLSSMIGFLLTDVVVPAANKLLAQGFPIPSSSSSGLYVNRTALIIEGGALQVLLDLGLNTTHQLSRIKAEPRRYKGLPLP